MTPVPRNRVTDGCAVTLQHDGRSHTQRSGETFRAGSQSAGTPPHALPESPFASNASRTARSRNSRGYFLGAAMTLILRGLRACVEAGAVQSASQSRLWSAALRRRDVGVKWRDPNSSSAPRVPIGEEFQREAEVDRKEQLGSRYRTERRSAAGDGPISGHSPHRMAGPVSEFANVIRKWPSAKRSSVRVWPMTSKCLESRSRVC